MYRYADHWLHTFQLVGRRHARPRYSETLRFWYLMQLEPAWQTYGRFGCTFVHGYNKKHFAKHYSEIGL